MNNLLKLRLNDIVDVLTNLGLELTDLLMTARLHGHHCLAPAISLQQPRQEEVLRRLFYSINQSIDQRDFIYLAALRLEKKDSDIEVCLYIQYNVNTLCKLHIFKSIHSMFRKAYNKN